jgi:hypothetical protein
MNNQTIKYLVSIRRPHIILPCHTMHIGYVPRPPYFTIQGCALAPTLPSSGVEQPFETAKPKITIYIISQILKSHKKIVVSIS